ncbi:MAG: AbrB/MazE/SpoVT family DNA-binding domain-containing protein [Rhodoblastus sp.]
MNAPSKSSFKTLKVTQVGNSLGVVLPREVLAELDVDKGDKLYLTKVARRLSRHQGRPRFRAPHEARARDHEETPQRPARTRQVASMTEWRFLDRAIILAVHEEQLAQHGGGVGLRDEGLLESALARPVNLAAYDLGGRRSGAGGGLRLRHRQEPSVHRRQQAHGLRRDGIVPDGQWIRADRKR